MVLWDFRWQACLHPCNPSQLHALPNGNYNIFNASLYTHSQYIYYVQPRRITMKIKETAYYVMIDLYINN